MLPGPGKNLINRLTLIKTPGDFDIIGGLTMKKCEKSEGRGGAYCLIGSLLVVWQDFVIIASPGVSHEGPPEITGEDSKT
jgi:hypothetical protein